MSIHWRNYSGARAGSAETQRCAEGVADTARARLRESQGRSDEGQGSAFMTTGDTLLAALARKGRDDVEVYECRIVRVGEEARRRSDPGDPEWKPEHMPKLGGRGECDSLCQAKPPHFGSALLEVDDGSGWRLATPEDVAKRKIGRQWRAAERVPFSTGAPTPIYERPDGSMTFGLPDVDLKSAGEVDVALVQRKLTTARTLIAGTELGTPHRSALLEVVDALAEFLKVRA